MSEWVGGVVRHCQVYFVPKLRYILYQNSPFHIHKNEIYELCQWTEVFGKSAS